MPPLSASSLDDPWGCVGCPVDPVGLGTAPVRHQLLVLHPRRLDVEPVHSHQDVVLLEDREQPDPLPPWPPASLSRHSIGHGLALSSLRGILSRPIFAGQLGTTPFWGCAHCLQLLPVPTAHAPNLPHARGAELLCRAWDRPWWVPHVREWRGSQATSWAYANDQH